MSGTYNAKHEVPLLRVLSYDNVYKNVTQSRANVFVSRFQAPQSIEKELLEIDTPKNLQNIVHIANKKTALLAFSLPLIAVLTSSRFSLPNDGTVSLSELRAKIQEVPTNGAKNIWAFPLEPHESFKDVFANDQEYEAWIQSIDENFTSNTDLFSKRYSSIPYLAVLRDVAITYKFIPSHVFFNQPYAFRNLFSIALLSDDESKVPIVSPIFISARRSTVQNETRGTKKLLRWLMKSGTHDEILAFDQELFKDVPSRTQFFKRSYSNNKEVTSTKILPRNSWLANYGPRYSSLYFARSQ